MTIFWAALYFIGMNIHFQNSTGYFNSAEDGFHFGTVNAIFEALIYSRIPKLSYRVGFFTCNAVVRAIFMPPKDKSLLNIQAFSILFAVFLDWDKEKLDKNLFGSYFNYKQQLLQFKNLVSQDIPEGIVIITKDLKECLYMNNFFKKLTGREEEKDITPELDNFVLQEFAENPATRESLLDFLVNEIKKNEINDPENRKFCNVVYQKPENPNNHVFEAKIIHIIWDEKPSIALIFHDITQQQTIISLKMADSHKDQILATVSHELRTPLNSILGMVQIMMKQVNDETLRHYLDICKNSGNLLLGLVNSILDLNQIRANKLKLNPERIELRVFLKDIMHLFEFQCAQKGIYLKLKLSALIPGEITTDKNRLSQIFINLLGNALKFTNKGGITIHASQSPSKREIELSVEDTGIGIKEEDKGKLFKLFGKLDQENNSNINLHGIGLGLTISDNLARLLNEEEGEGIRLESEYGKGSKFSFRIKTSLHKENDIPLLENMEEVQDYGGHASLSSIRDTGDVGDVSHKMKNYASLLPKLKTFQQIELMNNQPERSVGRHKSSSFKQLANPPPLNSKHINTGGPFVLIVDDNPLNIMVAEHLVSMHKIPVKSVLSGHAALDLVLNNNHKEEPIRLILMDCQMPIMDGYQTTKSLKGFMRLGKIPEIPIVALTANDSEEDKEICKEAGMTEYLTKPLKGQELSAILKKYY